MSGETPEKTKSLEAVAASIPPSAEVKKRGPAPVHLWNPAYSGDIGLRIARDGSWWQNEERFTREALVRLFSTILRKDDDGRTYLVTPVEKFLIEVEDAPFIAVRVDKEGEGKDQVLRFLTNAGDEVVADADHPIRVVVDPATQEPAPYVLVRGRLEARIARAAFYEMAEWAEEAASADGPILGVRSGGAFFPLAPAGAHVAGDAA